MNCKKLRRKSNSLSSKTNNRATQTTALTPNRKGLTPQEIKTLRRIINALFRIAKKNIVLKLLYANI